MALQIYSYVYRISAQWCAFLHSFHYTKCFYNVSYLNSIIQKIENVQNEISTSFKRIPFMTGLTEGQSYYWIYFEIYSSPCFWFLIILVVVAAFIPDIIIKVFNEMTFSTKGRKESVNTSFFQRLNSLNKVEDVVQEYRF